MDNFLKKIANSIIIVMALTSLAISLKIEFIDQTSILILSGMTLFVIFIVLIASYIFKLEKRVDEIEKDFKTYYSLIKVWKEIEKIKRKI